MPAPQTKMEMHPTFDAHLHIWESPWENFLVGTGRSGRLDQYELVSGLLNKHGVKRGCVIAACNPDNPNNNQFVAEICRNNPDRFVMLSEIRVSNPERDQMLERSTERRALGFRYMPAFDESPVHWMEYVRFWERVASEELVVSLNLSPKQAIELEPLILRFRGIKWMLDHMGRPRFDMPESEYRGVLNLASYPNVFVKISGFYAFTARSSEYPYLDLVPFIKALRDSFGSDRMLWGSDAPPVLDFGSYEQSYACLLHEEMGLDVKDLEWIFGKTAEKIFPAKKRAMSVPSLEIA